MIWKPLLSLAALAALNATAFAGKDDPAKVDAPLNDHRSGAFDIGNGETAFAIGGNAGATVDPWEYLAFGTGRTVWYSWTAPRTTWVTSDTFGSACDTVLAVYDGDKSARPLLANDNSSGTVQSRVHFQAEQGHTYFFQIGGDCEGAIHLNVFPSDTPEFIPTELTLTPGAVDVTRGTVWVEACVRVHSKEPLDAGVFRLFQPDGEFYGEFPFTAANRTGGDALDGRYCVRIPLYRSVPPGDWCVNLDLLNYSAKKSDGGQILSRFGPLSETAFPPGLPLPCITVTNSGIFDEIAPFLFSIKATPYPVDIRAAGQCVSVDFKLWDYVGVRDGTFRIVSPEGRTISVPFSQQNLISGNPLEGVYRIQFCLPKGAPSGQWRAEMSVYDVFGNGGTVTTYYNSTAPLLLPVVSWDDPYDRWAFRKGLFDPTTLTPQPATDSNPLADPDGDGLVNLTEYAYGLDPLNGHDAVCTDPVAGNPGLPWIHVVEADGLRYFEIRLVCLKPEADPHLQYIVETSSDLLHWQQVEVTKNYLTEGSGGYPFYQLLTAPQKSPRLYARVRVLRY